MDLIDEVLTKSGYDGFTYNKNVYDAVFVKGADLTIEHIDDNRALRIYPEIYINKDIFTSKYGCSGIIFRFEFTDRSIQDDRYQLCANTLTISDGESSLQNVFDGLPDIGDYNQTYYLSKFSHRIKNSELVDFSSRLSDLLKEDRTLVLTLDTENKTGTAIWGTEKVEPITLVHECSAEDTEALVHTVSLYADLLTILGAY